MLMHKSVAQQSVREKIKLQDLIPTIPYQFDVRGIKTSICRKLATCMAQPYKSPPLCQQLILFIIYTIKFICDLEISDEIIL